MAIKKIHCLFIHSYFVTAIHLSKGSDTLPFVPKKWSLLLCMLVLSCRNVQKMHHALFLNYLIKKKTVS